MITELLGFSQSYQWYTGYPVQMPGEGTSGSSQFPLNPATGFQAVQILLDQYPPIPNWQARFRFGGDLSKWKEKEFDGWRHPLTHNVQHARTEVDRVIFNMSGASRSVPQWQADIEAVMQIIHEYYSNLTELYLQPVIGGNSVSSGIRAAENHPTIVAVVRAIVAQSSDSRVKIGPIVTVNESDFADRIGHLTEHGAKAAKKQIFDFYQEREQQSAL